MRNARLLVIAISMLIMLSLAGCQPIQGSGVTLGEDASAGTVPPASEGATEESSADEATMDDGSAIATIATRSLRVRQEPSEDAEVVFGVSEGEQYRVLEISPDGAWVRLAIEEAEGGGGWVAANLVTVEGELTGDAMTAAPAEEATATPSEEEVAPPATGLVRIVTDGTRLRVRSEPNTEAEIVGYVYSGEEYELLSQSDDGTWVQIAGSTAEETDNPDGGWVASEFVLIGE